MDAVRIAWGCAVAALPILSSQRWADGRDLCNVADANASMAYSPHPSLGIEGKVRIQNVLFVACGGVTTVRLDGSGTRTVKATGTELGIGELALP